MIRVILIFVGLVYGFLMYAQNTVGTLTYNEDESYDGYNLIYPHNQSTVFLLNNCGDIIHTWTDGIFSPGNTAYLLENGNLVKTKRGNSPINDPIWAGGGGETIEVRDWDNNLVASYTLNNEVARLHHDIAITPEGNVLMIAWELKTLEEALSAGRDPNTLANDILWSEMILEWNPNTDEIVWEWHAWDHLVQDFDSSVPNFGIVANHPELIDLNYDEHDGHQDWLHFNSIDYNPVLDQIALSVPYFNEIWIIDHSTTSGEAASHTGGSSNLGGDLLYRWGNPATYRVDSPKKLFFQHDVKWVDPLATSDSENFGLLSLYNNRVNSRYSTSNSIQTSFNTVTRSYEFVNGFFSPETFERTIIHPDTIIMAVSAGLSSTQFLPNGNVLTHSGRWGYAYEVNSDNELVWEYKVPLVRGAPVAQGTEIDIVQNLTFRMDRYSLDYDAFIGRDLTPKQRLELEATSEICDVISATKEIDDISLTIKILGNPLQDKLNLYSDTDDEIKIVDVTGSVRKRFTIKKGYNTFDMQSFSSGLWYLITSKGEVQKFVVL